MPRAATPKASATVRMYRHGLGDCFLLRFTEHDRPPFHVLLDCGVIVGTEHAEARMVRVAEDIAEVTGGEIHLLIVTHEHWDHVSGFLQARQVFDRLHLHNVWLAWTEDPQDELARHLAAEFRRDRETLRLALKCAAAAWEAPVRQLLEFYGPGAWLGATAGADSRAALHAVHQLAEASHAPVRYLKPGEGPLALPHPEGDAGERAVRAYVLGPPRDERALRAIRPTRAGDETYREGFSAAARAAFRLAVQPAKTPEEMEARSLNFPFDDRVRIAKDAAPRYDFFRNIYGFADEAETLANPAWRRIDEEWLSTGAELALQMDSYTNNTSLVLAFELLPAGKVLLFAADAQIGSWLSWRNLPPWTVGPRRQPNPVTAADLLARTVLYKVGHHGSHNATVRGQAGAPWGLELMESPELTALLPVDGETARRKGWGQMPFGPLLDRLDEKTNGRVLRADAPFPEPPAGCARPDWNAFRRRVRETELYYEVMVEG